MAVSQRARHRHAEPGAAKWNSAIHFIIYNRARPSATFQNTLFEKGQQQ